MGDGKLKILARIDGITQAEVARRAGLSPSTVCRVVAGTRKISDRSKERIAEVLGRPVEEVFPESE